MKRSAADVILFLHKYTAASSEPFILVPQWSLSPSPAQPHTCPSYSLRHFPTQSPPERPKVASMGMAKAPHSLGRWARGEGARLGCSLCVTVTLTCPRAGSAGAVWGWLMASEPFIPDGMGTSDVIYGTPVSSRLLSQVGFSPGSVKVTNRTVHGSMGAGLYPLCSLHSPTLGSAPALYLTWLPLNPLRNRDSPELE